MLPTTLCKYPLPVHLFLTSALHVCTWLLDEYLQNHKHFWSTCQAKMSMQSLIAFYSEIRALVRLKFQQIRTGLCCHVTNCRGVGEWGAGGAVAPPPPPPTFESWGAQPLQFFTSLCAVVIV